MRSKFVLHQHRTGRRHFDLRLLQNDRFRSWSLLQDPPDRPGQRRLAIEREEVGAREIANPRFDEQAFGTGPARVWDAGEVEITEITPRHLALVFAGTKLAGPYRLRRMTWYPGNHWLLEKEKGPPPKRSPE
jgi:bifunctional non-homologous end joining protein LigD